MVGNVCCLPGAAQNRPFPAPTTAFHVLRLATHKILVYVDAVVGLKLFATALAD